MILLNRGGQKTLNIFCDASITKPKNPKEKVTGCAGMISVLMDNSGNVISENIVKQIIPNTTNNNSEVTAVLLGVYEALKYNGKVGAINLFSDSKITIMGLREWIFNWIRSINNGIMYSTSGTPVANQDIICQIINCIIYNNLNIMLFHQKGHVSGNNIPNAREVFITSNGIDISIQETGIISLYNDYVDRFTRNALSGFEYTEDRPIRPIDFPIAYCDMNKYKNLIKGSE